MVYVLSTSTWYTTRLNYAQYYAGLPNLDAYNMMRCACYPLTGGIFGLFDGRMEDVIKEKSVQNIQNWMQLSEDLPFEVP